jgi:hypothetical protein
MDKPQTFRKQYITRQNLPYVFGETASVPRSLYCGVLGRGQIVWMDEVAHSGRRPIPASAFVDGIGLISVDARWLHQFAD